VIDAELQLHIRTCRECEVVINAAGDGRVLACGWFYAHGVLPPWPPAWAKPGLLADAVGIWDANWKKKQETFDPSLTKP